jgi:hypothetical protein
MQRIRIVQVGRTVVRYLTRMVADPKGSANIGNGKPVGGSFRARHHDDQRHRGLSGNWEIHHLGDGWGGIPNS